MTSETVLCAFADLADPGAKGPFTVEWRGERLSVFVVRQGAEIHGWVDVCPHVGAPLEMEADQFLDLSGREILCTLHGARFHMSTGLCLLGPCKGRSLTPFPVAIRNGMVTTHTPTAGL